MRVQFAISALLVNAIAFAQHGSTSGVQVNEATVGARIFRAQCAGCHAPDGSGTGAGPALNTGTLKHGSSDEAIVATISRGVAGTTMPAFSFDALQMPQVVAHLRSLAIVRAATAVKGDPESGKMLFSRYCSGCHTPAGDFTGPDLSDVAARLSATELRQSISAPDAVVRSEYWSVTGRTRLGKTVDGVRLNEDTSSIQIRERDGKLSSVLKADLASFEIVRKSPMPAFATKLSATQIDDILAFLMKGQQK
jgi:cytochrome c oxidase cbb3-type subunit III